MQLLDCFLNINSGIFCVGKQKMYREQFDSFRFSIQSRFWAELLKLIKFSIKN